MKKKLYSLILSLCLVVGSISYTEVPVQAKTYVYYVPGSSYAYHPNRYCRTLKRSKNVKKITLKKAKSLHLSKYKVCH